MQVTHASPQRRSALLPTLAITSILVVLGIGFSYLWTDKLWFDALGYSPVFWRTMGTRVGLFAAFGLVMAAIIAVSVVLAFRLRPPTRRRGAASLALARYRELLEARLWAVAGVPALILGLMSGYSASLNYQTFLAWRHATNFNVTDPRFGLDNAFYVFALPWWRFVVSFAITAFVFALIAAAIVHFATGALRSGPPGRRQASRPAAAQLSVLAGLAIAGYGVQALLNRYGVLVTTNARFTGMSYTDDHVRIGAGLAVAIIAFIVAALFVFNAFVTRWITPVAGLVLLLVSGLLLSLIYPAAVQTFSVRPDEPDKEGPYIANHIAATRAAFGIDDVEITEYAAKTTVSAGQLRQDAEALPGIRLMDPAIIAPTFEQLQQVRGYYAFPSTLDVDRYKIDGVETDVVVAARELDQSGLPDGNWNTVHTVFTHGYGLVAAYGNRRQPAGEPDWIMGGIPPTGLLDEHQGRIYFGEKQSRYAIVGQPAGAQPIELDTPGGGAEGEKTYTYTGTGGVSIGSIINRALYAIRFGDVNLLLSDRVNPASKILYSRTPEERVEAAAPWLTVDQNIFPAVVKGRVVWIVDAYTTSNNYPNSQRVTLRDAASDTDSTGTPSVPIQAPSQINYIRNSVKAVVDAYDGTVTLYAWDDTDPVLQTWQKAFPGTIKAKSEISSDLMAHLRYPADLFKVQREMLGRYHMTNPQAWFNQSDLWKVPTDPVKGGTTKEPPYYLSIKWPGDESAVFSQTALFVPNARNNLAAYMAVNADAASPDYGRLRVLRMSDSKQIDGPGQTANAINTNVKVAERLRPFLNQGAATAKFGNLLTLPLGGGLLYVQPIYTMREGNNGANYPALRFVVVRFGEHVGIGDTLQQALDEVFKGDAGASTSEETETGDEPSGTEEGSGKVDNPTAVRHLRTAEKAFDEADAALKAGDLATYQTKTDEAKDAVAKALKALGS